MPDLDDGRKDQIIAGVLLVQSLMHKLREAGHKRMTICGTALREGILIDYVQRKQPSMRIRREVPDPRRRSVLDLCRRCEWHKGHSEQVTWLTLRLFDELKAVCTSSAAIDRELIEYAALMHDVGWHIGRKKHHKHSRPTSSATASSKISATRKSSMMANVARYHRKAHPKKSHDLYATTRQPRPQASWTPGAVVAAHRRRPGPQPRGGRCVRSTRRSRPTRSSSSLDVRADAELEVWGARRKAGLAAETFGREIEFETR